MSRLRLKSINPLKKQPQQTPVIKKSSFSYISTHNQAKTMINHNVNQTRCQQKKMKSCRSRGYLTRRQPSHRNGIIAKESNKSKSSIARDQLIGTASPPPNKSRSPSYNEIKKKRLMRDRKSRARLVKHGQLPLNNQQQSEINQKGLQKQEKKIKSYINHLENMLGNIQAERQRTDRKLTNQVVQQNGKGNIYTTLTDRKDYRLIEAAGVAKDENYKQTVKVGLMRKPSLCQNSSDESHSNLVQQIIQKTKQQHRLVKLNQVRNQYKQISPSKSNRRTEGCTLPDTISSTDLVQRKSIVKDKLNNQRSIRAYQTVSQQDKENQMNDNIHTIEEEDTHKTDEKPSAEDKLPSDGTWMQIKIDCSEIEINDKRDSFFSDPPSYLNEQQPAKVNKDHVVIGTSKVLNLLEIDTMDLKKAFKSKDKKKLVEKWKRNFPEGFFEEIDMC